MDTLGFFVPPPFAIAHHLIRIWAQSSGPWFPPAPAPGGGGGGAGSISKPSTVAVGAGPVSGGSSRSAAMVTPQVVVGGVAGGGVVTGLHMHSHMLGLSAREYAVLGDGRSQTSRILSMNHLHALPN